MKRALSLALIGFAFTVALGEVIRLVRILLKAI